MSQRTYPKMPGKSILHQMAFNHFSSKRPAASPLTTLRPSKRTTTIATTTTTTSSTTTTTTSSPATTSVLAKITESSKVSDVPKIINSVKTFTRYYIPPEVKISHTVSTE